MEVKSLLPTDEDNFVTIDGGSISRCDICGKPGTPVIHLDKTASSKYGKVCPTCFKGDDIFLSVFAYDNGFPESVENIWNDDHILPSSVREEVITKFWSDGNTAEPEMFVSAELTFLDIPWSVILEYGCLYSEVEGVKVVQPFAKSRVGILYDGDVSLLGGETPIWTKMFMETISVYATEAVLDHQHPYADRVV